MHASTSIRETLNLIAPQSAACDRLRYRAVLQFVAASDDIRKALRTQLARDGLTLEGFQALAALQQETEHATPTTLAHKIGTTRALLSHTLSRLEFSGLVSRQRDVKDRRIVWVHLTALGRTTVEIAAITCNQAVLKLVSQFDDSDLDGLLEACAKLQRGAAALN